MKKIALAFLLLSSATAFSQTEKGAVLVGGALSFQTTSNNSSFVLNPNVGFFPFNNFAFGLGTNFNYSKQGDIKSNQVGIGPFLRYYVGKTQTKPFITTEISYLHRKFETSLTESSSNGFGFLLGLGFAAFVNETVAIEGLTGYNYSDFNDASSASGFTMRFGFQLYFNRKNYDALKTNVIGQ
jgi:outer membrane protein